MDKLRQHLPPPNSLVAFEAAARLLSFTRAARELNVSQPAISRQVLALEGYLETPLFIRANRKLQLTEAGQSYYQSVSEGLIGIAEAGREIRQTAEPDRVSIAAHFGFAAFWLVPRLNAFREAYPEIDLRLITSDRDTDPEEDGVDIAIRFGGPDWGEYRSGLLFRERVFPVCSPGFLKQHPEISDPTALMASPLLHLEEQSGLGWCDWRSWSRQQIPGGIRRPGGASFSNYVLVIQAALAGQGIALGWQSLVDDLLQDGLLTRPLDTVFESENGYFAVWKKGTAQQPAVAAFLDWLLAECGRTRA